MRGIIKLFVAIVIAAQAMSATELTLYRVFKSTDVAVAGVSGIRNSPAADITIGGISGRIQAAYLYWDVLSDNPEAVPTYDLIFRGVKISGSNVGTTASNCWGHENTQAYRADVTLLVNGNGTYRVAGLAMANGASLIVFYDDGISSNDRDFLLYDGNDSNVSSKWDNRGWNTTLEGLTYAAGPATLQLHVADGQAWDEAAVYVNGTAIAAGGQIFDGDTLPVVEPSLFDRSNMVRGALWDIRDFDISKALTPGTTSLRITSKFATDCLALVVGVVSLPEGSLATERVAFEQNAVQSCAGANAGLTARVTDTYGVPVAGRKVTFRVSSGPNANLNIDAVTAIDGRAVWNYASTATGTDVITACLGEQCSVATRSIVDCGQNIDTSAAEPTVACLWPPNRQLVGVGIKGVKDPLGAALSIAIDNVTSDEPTASVHANGSMQLKPDAVVSGNNLWLRAERLGWGDGRVYEIWFTASAEDGRTAQGSVQVRVPKSMSSSCSAGDTGQRYDAQH